jgi:hypothetical protein
MNADRSESIEPSCTGINNRVFVLARGDFPRLEQIREIRKIRVIRVPLVVNIGTLERKYAQRRLSQMADTRPAVHAAEFLLDPNQSTRTLIVGRRNNG